MAHITSFEVGHCAHPACMVQRGAGFASCLFPARAYLIEAAGSGCERRWLWDTGYSSHFHDHTRDGLFSIYRHVTPVNFDSAQSLRLQLKARGIAPADLDGLLLSHFHGDHIAGLRDFDAVPMVCSGSGWNATRTLRGISALRKAFVPGLMPADFEQRISFVESFVAVELPAALAPFTHGRVLPGSDGEVLLVDLPGHAAGHLGAFVATRDGWELLASDAAWTHANYRELQRPSRLAYLIMDDACAYDRTLQMLHELDRAGGAAIRLTHEEAIA